MPDLDSADQRPRIPVRLWLRLHGIREARRELRLGAARMRHFLPKVADGAGRIGDVRALYRRYADEHGVSERQAAEDLRAADAAGMVRCTARPAPGRSARYVLTFDVDQIPDVSSLPGDLVAAFRRSMADGRPVDGAEEHGQAAAPIGGTASATASEAAPRRAGCRIGRARGDALLAECEVVRVGASSSTVREAERGHGVLHLLPLTREGNPHPRYDQRQRGTRPGTVPNRGTSGIDDRGLAEVVLDRCGPAWRAQRGPGGDLDEAQRAQLVPLVAGALRYLASGDVVEAMTDRVASARSLGAVVASRARTVIQRGRAARRRADELADEHGEAYAAMVTRREAEAAKHRPPPAVAAELDRFRAAHPAAPPTGPRRRPSWHTPAAADSRTAPGGELAPASTRDAVRPGLWEIEQAAAQAAAELAAIPTPTH